MVPSDKIYCYAWHGDAGAWRTLAWQDFGEAAAGAEIYVFSFLPSLGLGGRD